jgi:hypothetical protein
MTRARVEKANQFGAAQMGRNALFQQLGLDRREQAELVGLGQARRIDGDEDVGRAVGALVADALQQFVFLALDAVDLDAGLAGEIGYRSRAVDFVGLVVAGGIEVEHLFLRKRLVGVGGGDTEETGEHENSHSKEGNSLHGSGP